VNPLQKETTDTYFLDSANNVSFFLEEKAFDAAGKLQQDKAKSINKIGHGRDTFHHSAGFISARLVLALDGGIVLPADFLLAADLTTAVRGRVDDMPGPDHVQSDLCSCWCCNASMHTAMSCCLPYLLLE
jgi:hypothetical protein